MQKPLALSIAVCLSLTSCQVFEKSRTWDTVVNVRPGDAFRQADPSSFYAEKLHAVLLDQGVEHFVVTYQYHYYTSHYEEALSTRTAVVYRDDTNPRYPWWLKDDRTATPVWLPEGDLDKQLSFYCRRPAHVIEAKHYLVHGGSGKAMLPPPRTSQQKVQLRGSVAQRPQPHPHVAERVQPVTKITQAKAAQPQAVKTAGGYHHPTTERAAVTKIQRPGTASVSPAKPAGEELAPVAAGPHLNSFWSPPTMIDPVQQASDPVPRDAHVEKLFRARNGTNYDPTSAIDRRKMEQLKHGLVGEETNGARGFRRGVDGGLAY
jgi:hypothetical protein